jgi:hypothetical protein
MSSGVVSCPAQSQVSPRTLPLDSLPPKSKTPVAPASMHVVQRPPQPSFPAQPFPNRSGCTTYPTRSSTPRRYRNATLSLRGVRSGRRTRSSPPQAQTRGRPPPVSRGRHHPHPSPSGAPLCPFLEVAAARESHRRTRPPVHRVLRGLERPTKSAPVGARAGRLATVAPVAISHVARGPLDAGSAPLLEHLLRAERAARNAQLLVSARPARLRASSAARGWAAPSRPPPREPPRDRAGEPVAYRAPSRERRRRE